MPQRLPHRAGRQTNTEARLDQRGNPQQRPQLVRISGRNRSALQQLRQLFQLDIQELAAPTTLAHCRDVLDAASLQPALRIFPSQATARINT
ncbi:MAG: hypothetical protein WDO68_21520 [Gammaproteobacteria bacterium]